MTSTINRVMVVELALPALVPGLLVATHHAVQILRPAWGYGSTSAAGARPGSSAAWRRSALGGFGAACGTALAATDAARGSCVAALGFLAVGLGAGSAGTSVLAHARLGRRAARRAAAATTVWVMMIFGFAVIGAARRPFPRSLFATQRLIEVMAAVSPSPSRSPTLAVCGVETRRRARQAAPPPIAAARSSARSREVWRDRAARRFTIFIFVSMLAYSAQELLVEPFAGLVFAHAAGRHDQARRHPARRRADRHALVAVIGFRRSAAPVSARCGSGRWRAASPRRCAGRARRQRLLRSAPILLRCAARSALGVSNGVYAVAAIGSMMGLAGRARAAREGTRMGLWGAAQAIAFGARRRGRRRVLVDLARDFGASPLTPMRWCS